MQELGDVHWWYRARREIVCSLVAKYVRPGAQIIDYGAGTGNTALALHGLGFRVTVADISAPALLACRESGLPVIDLTHEALPAESADCILACDVLEHVENESDLLEEFKRALRPRGILIVTVPAFEFLWSGEDYVSAHLRRHTRRSVSQSIKTGGFTQIWSSYFNTLLFPLAAVNILAMRLFRPRDMYRSNIKKLPQWQNELLYRVFSLEQHLLRSTTLPIGVSIVVVARYAS